MSLDCLAQCMELSGVADEIRDTLPDSIIQTAANVHLSQDDLTLLLDALASVDGGLANELTGCNPTSVKDSIPTHSAAVVPMDIHLPNDGKQHHPVNFARPNVLSAKKGQASYVEIISTSILKSKNQKLLVSELYESINRRYPQFSLQESTWKKGVRHTLSSNSFFIQNGRGPNGRVYYWSVHSACVSMFRGGDFRRQEARRRVQNMQRENASMNQQVQTLDCSPNITNNIGCTGAEIQPQEITSSNVQSSMTELNYSSYPSMSSNAIFTPQQLHQLHCQIQFYQQLQHLPFHQQRQHPL